MKSDEDLLREFTRTHDERCFAELVQRHIPFVYATCLRRMPHGAAAKDATQAVFVALARKAESVVNVPSLVGWLHRSACYQTRYALRSEKNRVARESEAHRLGTTLPEPHAPLDEIAPILEDGGSTERFRTGRGRGC